MGMFDLSGRVAIVTGGTRGIGRAIAEGFAACGAKVVVASRKPEACEETARALVSCGGEAYFTRDPRFSSDPATLLRWSPDAATLSVAFASRGTGNAFLAPPRCGGDHLTVTAYSSRGDQQMTARVG